MKCRSTLPWLVSSVLMTFAIPCWSQCETGTLLPSVAAPGDHFGSDVAISGDVAVVGAELDHGAGPFVGAVDVYRVVGSEWVFEQRLVPPGTPTHVYFGYSVAISGDTILVGAPFDMSSTGGGGSVFFFERGPSGWAFTQNLIGSDTAPGDMFGGSVGLDGDVAAVGAVGTNGFASNTGAAYVFERVGGTWGEAQKLFPSSGSAFDLIGSSVAVQGTRIVVGAYSYDALALIDPGAAFVFERVAGSWTFSAALHASTPDAYAYFGYSVAISENTILVGAPGDNEHSVSGGNVYAFAPQAGTWVETEKLVRAAPAPNDYFGIGVAIDGDLAIVGSYRSDAMPATPVGGEVHVYRRSGSFVETAHLIAAEAAPQEILGVELALSGNRAVLSSLSFQQDPARVYTFALGAPECSLSAPQFAASLAQGATIQLSLDAGPAAIGKLYWMFGSLGGTDPGLDVQGVHLPLNFDGPGGYLLHSVLNPNAAPLFDSLAFLDARGRGTAVFGFGAGFDASLAGIAVHHAYLLFDIPGAGGVTFASNPVHLRLSP